MIITFVISFAGCSSIVRIVFSDYSAESIICPKKQDFDINKRQGKQLKQSHQTKTHH